VISPVHDLDQCQRLWESLIPPRQLFDIWDVRACFQRAYGNAPYFIVAQGPHGPHGLLALSRIEADRYWGFFPGETFKGKTWLEQNRIMADTPATAAALLDACPSPCHLRYLTEPSAIRYAQHALDEIGYLFRPPAYDYRFDRYLQAFSGKRRRNLFREMNALAARGISYRTQHDQDIDRAFELNLQAFGKNSYFSDDRFLAAFLELTQYLRAQHLLRVTTVLVAGQVAAVDLGAVYRGTYTVFAGGTHPEIPGVAKAINLYHLEWACRERLDQVDFLCGDFGWKERFHLTPRPLYQVSKGSWESEVSALRGGVLSHAG
jgi:hypothetical protein